MTKRSDTPLSELLDLANGVIKADQIARNHPLKGFPASSTELSLAQGVMRLAAQVSETGRTYIAGLQRAWAIVNGRKAGRDSSDAIWRELTKIEHIIEQEENYAASRLDATTPNSYSGKNPDCKRGCPSEAWCDYDECHGRAVARGWCSPRNSHKQMDADLASSIAVEVDQLLSPGPKQP